MSRARAQIRRPLDSRAQVTITLVDTNGAVLGLVRSPDAPIFGTDVSLQKARTAAFFSSPFAAPQLLADPDADVRRLRRSATRDFFDDPAALTGSIAFADALDRQPRAALFPDGEVGRPPGPLSRPIEEFNPFSTGLQSALIKSATSLPARRCSSTARRSPTRRSSCTLAARRRDRAAAGSPTASRSSPAAVPIYRGSQLVGAIGVSGDGIDQDDMISFLGLTTAARGRRRSATRRSAIRADQIVIAGRRRACGCATSAARSRRSSTPPSRTSARGSR